MVSTDGQRGGAIQLRPDGRQGRSLCSLPDGVHSKDYRPARDFTRAHPIGPSLTSFTFDAETQAFRPIARPSLCVPRSTRGRKVPQKSRGAAGISPRGSAFLSVPLRLCVKRRLPQPRTTLRFLLLARLGGEDEQRGDGVGHALGGDDDLAHVLAAG